MTSTYSTSNIPTLYTTYTSNGTSTIINHVSEQHVECKLVAMNNGILRTLAFSLDMILKVLLASADDLPTLLTDPNEQVRELAQMRVRQLNSDFECFKRKLEKENGTPTTQNVVSL